VCREREPEWERERGVSLKEAIVAKIIYLASTVDP
jgi:hypothetical protein